MAKTSVYLNRELTARWKDSALPLAELVRRGLDAPDLEAVIREIRARLAGIPVPATDSTRDTASSAPPPPVAAMPVLAVDAPSYVTEPCRHPAQSVDGGWCRECQTELD